MLERFDVVYLQTANGIVKDYVVGALYGGGVRLLQHGGYFKESDFVRVLHREPLPIGTKVKIKKQYDPTLSTLDYPTFFISTMLKECGGKLYTITNFKLLDSDFVRFCLKWPNQFDGFLYRINDSDHYSWTLPMFDIFKKHIKVPEHVININLFK